MKLTGRIADISIDYISNTPKLTLAINEKNDLYAGYDDLKDIDKLSVEIKPYRKKRSLNANAYLWVLCDRLADKLGITKEEVYRRHIFEVGIFKPIEISEKAVDTFIHSWQMHGTGWVAEKVDSSETEGFVTVNVYYGSSTYNTKQMSRLLDSVIEDCKEQGVETVTPEELESMKNLWKGRE